MYYAFYCKQCKYIPFIKPNITINKEIKFMIKCKFHTDYLAYEQLEKTYFSKDIDIKNIINNRNISEIKKNIYLKGEMTKLLNKIRHNSNSIPKIKNKFLDIINSKVKEIEQLFDKLKVIYNYFEKFAQILIKSYECDNTNNSNINNLKFNIYEKYKTIEKEDFEEILDENKIDSSINNIKNYIDEIIPINYDFEQVKLVQDELYFYQAFKITDEFLLVRNEDSLYIHKIDDSQIIAEIKTPDINKIQMDKQNNIICFYSNSIKILPKITNTQIENCKIKINPDNINEENIMNYGYTGSYFFHLIKIETIIEFNVNIDYSDILYWHDENDKTIKDKCIIYYKTYIDFFNYDLNKKLFSKFYSLNLKKNENICEIGIINKNDKKILLIFTTLNLNLFDLSSLKIFKIFNIKFKENYLITINQFSSNEILFNNLEYVYILNMKNFNIKLKFKFESGVTHSFLLKDKSIVICGVYWAKRYSSKTFEIMNNFYRSRQDCIDDYKYSSSPDFYFIRNTLELTEKKILLILRYGNTELNEILF